MIIERLWRCFRLTIPPKFWPNWMYRLRQDRQFYRVFGRHINWKNPQSFNEKVNWSMIYFKDEIATRVSDKITFKDFVRERLGDGYTAELFGVWDNVDDIDFSVLTPPYVLKSNCSCDDQNLIIITEPVTDVEAMRNTLRQWLDWRNTGVGGYTNAYYRIKPKIIAEEYLGNANEMMLTDYKFYCFNGEPYCIYSDYRPQRFALYDLEWNVLDVKYDGRDICPVSKPTHFNDMLQAAKVLSKGFPFVRVDFYDIEDGIRVGELTFDSGWGLKSFTPESFDYELGEHFTLSSHLIIDSIK